MRKNRLRMMVLGFLLLMSACNPQIDKELQEVELIISAAASLTDALEEIEREFTNSYPNIRLAYNFGGSGKLKQQIEQGAPVDVFLSASQADMKALQQQQLIVEESLVDFTSNALVLIVHEQADVEVSSFSELDNTAISQIAVGDPETVPAGRYTKETLSHLQLWDKLNSRFVYASDVRQVLTYVELQNVDVGVVYQSDAKSSERVRILATADPSWHRPIIYPGAVIADSSHLQEATEFVHFLMSERGQEILEKYGFSGSREEES